MKKYSSTTDSRDGDKKQRSKKRRPLDVDVSHHSTGTMATVDSDVASSLEGLPTIESPSSTIRAVAKTLRSSSHSPKRHSSSGFLATKPKCICRNNRVRSATAARPPRAFTASNALLTKVPSMPTMPDPKGLDPVCPVGIEGLARDEEKEDGPTEQGKQKPQKLPSTTSALKSSQQTTPSSNEERLKAIESLSTVRPGIRRHASSSSLLATTERSIRSKNRGSSATATLHSRSLATSDALLSKTNSLHMVRDPKGLDPVCPGGFQRLAVDEEKEELPTKPAKPKPKKHPSTKSGLISSQETTPSSNVERLKTIESLLTVRPGIRRHASSSSLSTTKEKRIRRNKWGSSATATLHSRSLATSDVLLSKTTSLRRVLDAKGLNPVCPAGFHRLAMDEEQELLPSKPAKPNPKKHPSTTSASILSQQFTPSSNEERLKMIESLSTVRPGIRRNASSSSLLSTKEKSIHRDKRSASASRSCRSLKFDALTNASSLLRMLDPKGLDPLCSGGFQGLAREEEKEELPTKLVNPKPKKHPSTKSALIPSQQTTPSSNEERLKTIESLSTVKPGIRRHDSSSSLLATKEKSIRRNNRGSSATATLHSRSLATSDVLLSKTNSLHMVPHPKELDPVCPGGFLRLAMEEEKEELSTEPVKPKPKNHPSTTSALIPSHQSTPSSNEERLKASESLSTVRPGIRRNASSSSLLTTQEKSIRRNNRGSSATATLHSRSLATSDGLLLKVNSLRMVRDPKRSDPVYSGGFQVLAMDEEKNEMPTKPGKQKPKEQASTTSALKPSQQTTASSNEDRLKMIESLSTVRTGKRINASSSSLFSTKEMSIRRSNRGNSATSSLHLRVLATSDALLLKTNSFHMVTDPEGLDPVCPEGIEGLAMEDDKGELPTKPAKPKPTKHASTTSALIPNQQTTPSNNEERLKMIESLSTFRPGIRRNASSSSLLRTKEKSIRRNNRGSTATVTLHPRSLAMSDGVLLKAISLPRVQDTKELDPLHPGGFHRLAMDEEKEELPTKPAKSKPKNHASTTSALKASQQTTPNSNEERLKLNESLSTVRPGIRRNASSSSILMTKEKSIRRNNRESSATTTLHSRSLATSDALLSKTNSLHMVWDPKGLDPVYHGGIQRFEMDEENGELLTTKQVKQKPQKLSSTTSALKPSHQTTPNSDEEILKRIDTLSPVRQGIRRHASSSSLRATNEKSSRRNNRGSSATATLHSRSLATSDALLSMTKPLRILPDPKGFDPLCPCGFQWLAVDEEKEELPTNPAKPKPKKHPSTKSAWKPSQQTTPNGNVERLKTIECSSTVRTGILRNASSSSLLSNKEKSMFRNKRSASASRSCRSFKSDATTIARCLLKMPDPKGLDPLCLGGIQGLEMDELNAEIPKKQTTGTFKQSQQTIPNLDGNPKKIQGKIKTDAVHSQDVVEESPFVATVEFLMQETTPTWGIKEAKPSMQAGQKAKKKPRDYSAKTQSPKGTTGLTKNPKKTECRIKTYSTHQTDVGGGSSVNLTIDNLSIETAPGLPAQTVDCRTPKQGLQNGKKVTFGEPTVLAFEDKQKPTTKWYSKQDLSMLLEHEIRIASRSTGGKSQCQHCCWRGLEHIQRRTNKFEHIRVHVLNVIVIHHDVKRLQQEGTIVSNLIEDVIRIKSRELSKEDRKWAYKLGIQDAAETKSYYL